VFFVFAIISMAAYALHSVWMAPYYRRNDQLAVVTLRGVGLSIAMLPGLLIPGPAGVVEARHQLPWILAASATALLGNWAAANSLRYLPIGIATALNMSLSTLVSAGLSSQLLGESLSAGQVVWMGFIFLGVFALGAVRSPPVASVTYSLPRGMLFAAVFGLALGTGFTLISRVSRSLDPLVAGYCWESTITVMGAVVLLLRRLVWGRIGTAPSRRDLLWIVLFCIPGAVGTSCYALAVAGGPVAIVSAILGTMMVVSSVLAWLIYGEKLSWGQWLLVAFVCGAVVGMRFASG